MTYLQNIEAQMTRMQRNSACNAKRAARRSQLAKRRWPKVKPRRLANKFDDCQNNKEDQREPPKV